MQKHNQFEEYDVNKRQKWHLDSGSSILNTKIRKISVLKTLLLFNCANHRDKRPFVSTANEALVGTLMIYLPYNTKQTLLLKYIALPSHLSVHFCIPRTRLSKKSFVGFHMARTTSRDFVARGRPLRGQKRLAPLAKRSTCSMSSQDAKHQICIKNNLFLCL